MSKSTKVRFSSTYLILQNDLIFPGYSPTWVKEDRYGEVVFTTGMTGYPETLTDPSYKKQILVFTYPLIGNYGIPSEEAWESEHIHLHGVVISDPIESFSHYSGIMSLLDLLKKYHIPLIGGVDTRALTKVLRSQGTMGGVITHKKSGTFDFSRAIIDHPVKEVSPSEEKEYGAGKKKIIVVDCGMKENIVRSLSNFPVIIKRVPYDYDYSEEEFDGVFLSNGPGDPVQCEKTIEVLRKVMKQNKPIFGICLGTQLMALAAGAETYKLPYGHRGQNQPCKDLETGQCFVTSQNHGYAVDEKSLPRDWKVWFKNLNDGSVEGIKHRKKPFSAVQFHPEASPGPTDTLWLFEHFLKQL